jgi:murein DD-endopeptidase MepM/ murein hydrolase activator NlpD
MPRTTSQLFGLSQAEFNAAVNTALGEAGPRDDIYGPFVTLLNRKLSGVFPGNNLVTYAKAPGQFIANDKYSAQQISDPAFGRKVFGSRYDQAYNALSNPDKLLSVVQKLRGAVEFKGQAIPNKYNDPMLDKLGNFYHNFNPTALKKATDILKSAGSTINSGLNQAQQNGQTIPVPVQKSEIFKLPEFNLNQKISEIALANALNRSKNEDESFYSALEKSKQAQALNESGDPNAEDVAEVLQSNALNSLLSDEPKSSLVNDILQTLKNKDVYDKNAKNIEQLVNLLQQPSEIAKASTFVPGAKAETSSISLGKVARPGEDYASTGPHGHFEVRDKNGNLIPLSKSARSFIGTRLFAGDRPLFAQKGSSYESNFPLTSGMGPRGGIGSHDHAGEDYAIAQGVPLTWKARPGDVYTPGKMNTATIKLTDDSNNPYTVRILHANPGAPASIPLAAAPQQNFASNAPVVGGNSANADQLRLLSEIIGGRMMQGQRIFEDVKTIGYS